jgi:hypothetical protein
MPAIKPRTRQKHSIRHITRLYKENNETLFAYAAFIGEPTDYVLNQLIDSVLAKDRDFHEWRAEHPESKVPTRASKRSGAAPRTSDPASPSTSVQATEHVTS